MTREDVRRGTRLLRALMPHGTPLPDEDWAKRHAVISTIALVHGPVVFVYALVMGVGLVHAVVETLPVAGLAILGAHSRLSRRAREVFTTLALVTSSAVLVHLSGGYIELHFHFFVIVALVTLYQQWSPFLVAIAFVAIHHGIAGAVAPTSVYNHPDAIAQPWSWAVVHAAFISMASAVGLANWKLNELARHRAEDYFRRLYEGESAVVQRLQEADRMKTELVAAVSHEFRTPLTAILGFASTLRQFPDIGADKVGDFAGRVHRQGRRLQHLVENLLEAERPLDTAEGACEAHAVIQSSVAVALEGNRAPTAVVVEMTPGLDLPVAAEAAQLIVTNLVVNALKFARPGSSVGVRAFVPTEGGVTIEVTNDGPEVPAHLRERIFEPFVQGDSSNTRNADGVGLGLHLVRRVVNTNGGRVAVSSDAGRTTFTVWLAPGPEAAASEPGRSAAALEELVRAS